MGIIFFNPDIFLWKKSIETHHRRLILEFILAMFFHIAYYNSTTEFKLIPVFPRVWIMKEYPYAILPDSNLKSYGRFKLICCIKYDAIPFQLYGFPFIRRLSFYLIAAI